MIVANHNWTNSDIRGMTYITAGASCRGTDDYGMALIDVDFTEGFLTNRDCSRLIGILIAEVKKEHGFLSYAQL